MFTRKGQDLFGLSALLAILAVATTVAMSRIGVSQRPIDVSLNPSPLGYTFSLILFVLPCAVLGAWVWQSSRTGEQRRASLITLAILIPIGFVLDLIFGRSFLHFPNAEATLGILIPAFDLGSGWSGLWGPGWRPYLPSLATGTGTDPCPLAIAKVAQPPQRRVNTIRAQVPPAIVMFAGE
jgi:hypothetical protein